MEFTVLSKHQMKKVEKMCLTRKVYLIYYPPNAGTSKAWFPSIFVVIWLVKTTYKTKCDKITWVSSKTYKVNSPVILVFEYNLI